MSHENCLSRRKLKDELLIPAPCIVIRENLYENPLILYLAIALWAIKGRSSGEKARFPRRRNY